MDILENSSQDLILYMFKNMVLISYGPMDKIEDINKGLYDIIGNFIKKHSGERFQNVYTSILEELLPEMIKYAKEYK